MLTVYKGDAKVDDWLKKLCQRLDKLDKSLDKLDSKVHGWVKWAAKFGVGGIIVSFGLVRFLVKSYDFIYIRVVGD